jgi:ribonuclease HI
VPAVPSEPAVPPAVPPSRPAVVYTDGACLGNPGPGGWAWAEPGGAYASGADPRTTNQRMEITAALEGVRAHPGPLEVVSDSTYVVNCFRDRWWEGWLRRGWTNAAKKPVANRDLWEPLVELVRTRGDVTFRPCRPSGRRGRPDPARPRRYPELTPAPLCLPVAVAVAVASTPANWRLWVPMV